MSQSSEDEQVHNTEFSFQAGLQTRTNKNLKTETSLKKVRSKKAPNRPQKPAQLVHVLTSKIQKETQRTDTKIPMMGTNQQRQSDESESKTLTD